MSFGSYPHFLNLISTRIMDSDSDQDARVTKDFGTSLSETDHLKLCEEIRSILAQTSLPLEDFGTEANRWFGTDAEAREWLQMLLTNLESVSRAPGTLRVFDSNGTTLEEGDSVSVIKDLKVRGGTSDLKRGTLIKKIHLTEDPGLIECKVDGSVLVLKTIFLKKS